MRWQAPELLRGSGRPTPKSDVYAFGLVCLEVCRANELSHFTWLTSSAHLQIFTSKIPWAGVGDGQVVIEVLVNDNRPPKPAKLAMRRGLDDQMWDLMTACWSKQLEKRPNMVFIVEELMPEYKWEEQPRARSRLDDKKSNLLIFTE